VNTLNDEYEIVPGAEICIEGSPLTITAPDREEKLQALKEQGVSRLSFGVQSFDEEVLKYAARGYGADVPIRACEIVRKIFDNWNLDLIQGLYKGSPTETWGNLKVISELLPAHLTWYHARFADRPQRAWYQTESKRGSFEDESETLLSRMLIWQGMADLGYQQTDGNRFVRQKHYTDPFKQIRTSATRNLLGIGASSYSHIGSEKSNPACRGYVFRNEPGIRSYVERISAGAIPIVTGRLIDDEETFATFYATGLRGGRLEDGQLRTIRMKKPDLSSHYEALVATLSDLRVLERYTDQREQVGLKLSELGRLFEDETLALFFSPAVQRALTMKGYCEISPRE
jgi:oxygen-independent coproporphyrinogen III oxidase